MRKYTPKPDAGSGGDEPGAPVAVRRHIARAARAITAPKARIGFASPLFATFVLVFGLCVLHVVWFQRFRAGYITDLDEAGYLALGLREARDLGVGPRAFLESVMNTGVAAPVVPLSTVPLYVVFGAGIGTGWAAMVPYFALLVLASFALACRLMPAWWAALAALVISTAPVVSDFTRLFHFAVPATALLTTGLWFLAKSDALLVRRWAIAGGVMLSLMILSRLMTVAYLPGVALALGMQVAAAREARRERVANLLLLSLVAAALAAPWYVANFDIVSTYLTGTGYGPEAGRYGTAHSIVSFDYWVKELRIVGGYLFAPLLLGLAGCFVAAACVVASTGAWRSWRRVDLRAAISSDAFLLTVVVVEGYVVLSTSANVGTAFSLPWLPTLIILAVAAAARIPPRPVRMALVLVLAGVSVFNVAIKNGVSAWLSRPAAAHLPVVGTVTTKDGRDRVYQVLEDVGYPVQPPPQRLPEVHRQWLAFSAELVAFMNRYARSNGQEPLTLVATGDWLLDDNRLLLASELTKDRALPVGKVEGPDTFESYRRQFERRDNNFLMTSEPPNVPIQAINPFIVAGVAIDLGFRQVKTTTAPDGRRVVLWWRSSG